MLTDSYTILNVDRSIVLKYDWDAALCSDLLKHFGVSNFVVHEERNLLSVCHCCICKYKTTYGCVVRLASVNYGDIVCIQCLPLLTFLLLTGFEPCPSKSMNQ